MRAARRHGREGSAAPLGDSPLASQRECRKEQMGRHGRGARTALLLHAADTGKSGEEWPPERVGPRGRTPAAANARGGRKVVRVERRKNVRIRVVWEWPRRWRLVIVGSHWTRSARHWTRSAPRNCWRHRDPVFQK